MSHVEINYDKFFGNERGLQDICQEITNRLEKSFRLRDIFLRQNVPPYSPSDRNGTIVIYRDIGSNPIYRLALSLNFDPDYPVKTIDGFIDFKSDEYCKLVCGVLYLGCGAILRETFFDFCMLFYSSEINEDILPVLRKKLSQTLDHD